MFKTIEMIVWRFLRPKRGSCLALPLR